MICQRFRTDWEKCLPSGEYGVMIGRTLLGLAVLGGLWRRVSREWRRALEMLRVMISKGYCLVRRDIARESSSFCSRVSSVMRRLYLRACEKTMLSLHLSEWLEWKCKSAAQSVGFLYKVVESLRSVPMRIFMSRKEISWVECSKVNLIVGWRLFMKSFMDWSCSVVPRKIRKISSMNLFQNGMAQIKASRMVSSWRPMKRLAYGGAALVPMAVPTSWRKCLSMNERLLFFRMVSSSIPIVWGLGPSGGRVLACNFM